MAFGSERAGNLLVDHFKTLYATANPTMTLEMDELLFPVISATDNTFLCKQPDEREIAEVVKHLGASKAPGPDGMPASFYQHYWKTIAKTVTRMIWNFFDMGFMLRQLNYTLVALIPKINNLIEVKQFRPIALCNVCYKIIAKILANRLKTLLPKIISSTQSAFVPGRVFSSFPLFLT